MTETTLPLTDRFEGPRKVVDREVARQVKCPTCGAAGDGSPCVSVVGGEVQNGVHVSRSRAAEKAGVVREGVDVHPWRWGLGRGGPPVRELNAATMSAEDLKKYGLEGWTHGEGEFLRQCRLAAAKRKGYRPRGEMNPVELAAARAKDRADTARRRRQRDRQEAA